MIEREGHCWSMVGGTRGFVVGEVGGEPVKKRSTVLEYFAVSVRQVQSRHPALVIVCTFHVGRYHTSTVDHGASVARIQLQ